MVERRNGQQIDLLNHQSEWGMTVSEASGRKSLNKRLLKYCAYVLFGAAALLAVPLVAGALFFPGSDGMALEIAIVVFALFLAIAFKFHSDKSERNSIQIDYRAAELRLGTQKTDGTFIREKVFMFRDIEKVRVRESQSGTAQLCVLIQGNDISIDFNGADLGSVEGLASQITAASESARAAPIRSRIQSKAHGIEASFREIKSRVQSRIAHA
ncbi:MAG: hypothetical protein AAF222_14900 [Pseudomonadota bacterium]